jgi:hypothetical protein
MGVKDLGWGTGDLKVSLGRIQDPSQGYKPLIRSQLGNHPPILAL